MLGWLLESLRDDKETSKGGGGGRARIRLGKTGPRGRIYAKAQTAKGRAKVVVKSKFVRAGRGSARHIGAHLKYIEERERGEDEKERDFFNRDKNGIEREEVEKAMIENRGEKVAMHKLILSPGDNSVDVREYARDSMEALEARLGYSLNWYGVVHENTDHHHAHIVIAGKVPEQERFDRFVERADDMTWKHERKEIRDLLGDELYYWTPALDRIEEREQMRQLGERERIAERDLDVVTKSTRSPEEVMRESEMEKYERKMYGQDVVLDRDDFRELRAAGDDYVWRERATDRSIERAVETEFGTVRSDERDFAQDRFPDEPIFDSTHSSWSDIEHDLDIDVERDRGDAGHAEHESSFSDISIDAPDAEPRKSEDT